MRSAVCSLLPLAFALAACGRGEAIEPKKAEPVEDVDADVEVYIPSPDVGAAVELSPPVTMLEAPAATTEASFELRQIAEPTAAPSAVIAQGENLIVALSPNAFAPGRIVSFDDKGKETVLDNRTGLVRALAVSGTDVLVLEHPLDDQKRPSIVLDALPLAGGERRELGSGEVLDNALAVAGEHAYTIARVEKQGTVGGLARVPLSGGEPTRIAGDLGPVFSLTSHGDRVYWSAHIGTGPDQIFSLGPGETEPKLHYSYTRGIVSLAVDDEHIYWVEAVFEPLSSTVARVGHGEDPTEARGLWRHEGFLLDHLRIGTEHLFFGYSAVEDVGKLFALGKGGGEAVLISEHPRVWSGMGGADEVFAQVAIEDGKSSGRGLVRIETKRDGGKK